MKKAINIVLAALMVLAVSVQAQKSVKIGNQVWMKENLNDASNPNSAHFRASMSNFYYKSLNLA